MLPVWPPCMHRTGKVEDQTSELHKGPQIVDNELQTFKLHKGPHNVDDKLQTFDLHLEDKL